MTTPGAYGGSSETQVATVRAVYDAFACGDVEGALEHIAEDCEMYPSGTSALIGREAPYRGHDGVREYFADAARVWEELTLHADDVRSAAGGVVVFGHVEGRSEGVAVRRRVVWVWQVRDGRAATMRVTDIGAAEPA